MKDISRNKEEDEGGRRRILKEEMIRRAEETRSFMMTKNSFHNNGFDGGNFKLLSPTGSGHQTKINIKIEREDEDDKGTEKGYQVGKENFFKVNIEKASEAKNGLNSENGNRDFVEKQVFINPKDAAKYRFLNGTEMGQNTEANPGFNVSIENGMKINIGNDYESKLVGSTSNKVPLLGVVGDNLNKKGSKPAHNAGLNDTQVFGNGFMTKNIPTFYEPDETKPNLYSDRGSKKEGMGIINGDHQNPKRESPNNDNFYNQDYGPQSRLWDAEECKCAHREAEKAQLRELNDRHLLLLSEKQGVINCLLQKIETLTQLKEVFIDEDRDKLKNDIEFLGSKIKDAEKQGEEAMKNDALKEEKIGDLENKIRDLELELERNKESLKEIDDLKKENAILISAKKADDEKMEWLANERDHDRENFDAFTKKVFTEKWEEILEKVDRGCDGKSYLENVEKKLEELRNAFDDRSAFDEMETKYKDQIAALRDSLEIEKENTANTAGDNSEMKCKIDILEKELEAAKKENEQIKDQLAAEKIASARELAEKEAETKHLKNLLPNLSQHGVGLGGVSGCVNNLPVDLAQELGVYSKILDAVGEEKEKERVEEVCKRIIHSKETTTTYHNGHATENGHCEEMY